MREPIIVFLSGFLPAGYDDLGLVFISRFYIFTAKGRGYQVTGEGGNV